MIRILKADAYLDSGQQFIEHEKSQQKSLPSFDLKEFISIQDINSVSKWKAQS